MNEPNPKRNVSRPETYRIKIEGHLDDYWSEWFDGLTMTYDENDDTILTGQVGDQSALYGLLKKVHDLALPLVSINPVEPDVAGSSGGGDCIAAETG